jgi:hypothetical protein
VWAREETYERMKRREEMSERKQIQAGQATDD